MTDRIEAPAPSVVEALRARVTELETQIQAVAASRDLAEAERDRLCKAAGECYHAQREAKRDRNALASMRNERDAAKQDRNDAEQALQRAITERDRISTTLSIAHGRAEEWKRAAKDGNAERDRLLLLMAEAVRDFHGKSVLFAADFLAAAALAAPVPAE